MTTYSIRCRNSACRHRRVASIHPDDYKRPPRCAVCGSANGWRIEDRAYNRRGLCTCSGPAVGAGRYYPHRTTHPLCDQHPHGFYNQARARGVAHDEIPEEYHPMAKKEQEMTRWDHYASRALAGVLAQPESGCNTPRDLAHWAAQCADALMAERATRMALLDCQP